MKDAEARIRKEAIVNGSEELSRRISIKRTALGKTKNSATDMNNFIQL